jgi:hypothetical protein
MTQLDVLKCPFAKGGIGNDAMAACPGFEATALVFDLGIGESIPPSQTCAHVGPAPTSRGFMAGCLHPDAPFILRVAEAALAHVTDTPLLSAVR